MRTSDEFNNYWTDSPEDERDEPPSLFVDPESINRALREILKKADDKGDELIFTSTSDSAPTRKPAEKPADKPVEKVAEKSVEKVAEKPVEKPAEKPAEKVAEKSADKPTPAGEPAAQKPSDKTPLPEIKETPRASDKTWLPEFQQAPTDKNVADVQDVLAQLNPTLNQQITRDKLIELLKNASKTAYDSGKMPPELTRELDQARAEGTLDAKLTELAAGQVRKLLMDQLDFRIRQGTIAATEKEPFEKMINEGRIPEELLLSALEREQKSNQFGPVTRAMYASAAAMLEVQVPANLIALTRASLPIPGDCPITLTMDASGRPTLPEKLVADIMAGKSPDLGLKTDGIPDVQALLRATRWAATSSRQIVEYNQEFQAKAMSEMCAKIGKPEWIKKEGEDRDAWIARVGPLLDLHAQVQACAQALKLAQNNSADKSVHTAALTKDFPGIAIFDRNGRLESLKLDLPDNLDATLESRQKIERIQEWLKKHEPAAKQSMAALAEVALREDRLLMWEDIPGKGKTADGQDFNLTRMRFRTEEVTGEDGKPKIRVYNSVERLKSEIWNYQDIGAASLETRAIRTMDAHGKEQEYRDLNPTDTVAVFKDGKVQLVLACELEQLRANAELMEKVGKGVSIALDIGMCVTGTVHLGAAAKGLRLAATMTGAAGAQARKAIMQEALAASKSLALGGSGFALNNSKVTSEEWGQKVNLARHIIFVSDGARSLYGTGKDALRWAGVLSRPALTAERQAAAAFHQAMNNWEAPGTALAQAAYYPWKGFAGQHGLNTWSMMTGEATLGFMLSRQIIKQADHIRNAHNAPDLAAARRLSASLTGNDNSASRFLTSGAESLASGDSARLAKLKDTANLLGDLEKMTDQQKKAKVDELLKRFETTQDKKERLLIAAGLLTLARNSKDLLPATSEIPQPSGSMNGPRRRPTAADLMRVVEEGVKTGPASDRLFAAQTLVELRKLSVAEYANACKSVLADANAPEHAKIQAMIGMSMAINAGDQRSRFSTAEERVAAQVSSFGATPDRLEAAIAAAAAGDQNPNVRAMAAALLHSLTRGQPESDKLLAIAVGKWQAEQLRKAGNTAEQEKVLQQLSLLQSPELIDQALANGGVVGPADRRPPSKPLSEQLLEGLVADLKAEPEGDPSQQTMTARKKLLALELLEKANISGVLKPEQINEVLFGLIKHGNADIAVSAFRRLLPQVDQYPPVFSAQQKEILRDFVKLALFAPHNAAPESDGIAERQAARMKVELLALTPEIFKTKLLNDEQKSDLAKAALSLIDHKLPGNNTDSLPELRLAAVRALGHMGQQNREVYAALAERMRPVSKDKPGEPNATIRMAACKALQELRCPDLQEYRKAFENNETDPALQSEYANMRFAALRPDRPESAEAIYREEVSFWQTLLANSQNRHNPKVIDEFLKSNFPLIHPDSYADSVAAAKLAMSQADTKPNMLVKILPGVSYEDAKKDYELEALKKYQDTVRRTDSWDRLLQEAKTNTSRGEMARAALLALATRGTTADGGGKALFDWQERAASEICKLIKEDCPNKEALFHGLVEAWRHTNTPDYRASRQHFIDLMNHLLDANPPKISKQYAGRIVHEALRLELDRMHRESVKDGDAMERQLQLIKLMEKADYPLAMAELHAIASGKWQDRPLHVSQKVCDAALALYRKLQDTAQRSPGNLDAQVASLHATVQARAKARTTMAELKDKPIEEVNARAADLEMDAMKTRKAILDACSTPITSLTDQRIPHLQTLLNDPDHGVALTAAWALINAANPQNTGDGTLRDTLKSQPWFKKAHEKIAAIAALNNDQQNAFWRSSALEYQKVLEKWGLYQPYVPKNSQLSGDALAFAQAKAVLDGTTPDESILQKTNAIGTIVRMAANGYFTDKPEMQKQAAEVLRQVAAGRDPVLGRAAYEAISRLTEQYKPKSQNLVANGVRITWPNGSESFIARDSKSQSIVYPDKSWIKVEFDERGQIVKYQSSKSTMTKEAGKDFAPGSINISPDGVLTHDEPNGIRTLVRPSGDQWSFYRKQNLAESATRLGQELARTDLTAADKAKLLALSTDSTTFDGAAITAGDPRLPLFKAAVASSDQAVRVAAAKALLSPQNQGIDADTLEKARSTYLREGGRKR